MTRPDARPRDAGSALILVLCVMTILSVIATVSLTYALRTQKFTVSAGDRKEALTAAEAGVDDYLARLNHNDTYWNTVDCANTALKGPSTGTNSCSWTSSTPVGWKLVAGSTTAWFHYDVVATSTPTNGTIQLYSTGRVGRSTRTVAVTLRRGGFGEFLYYTVYETPDPADENVYGANNTTAAQYCPRYYWGSPARPSSVCKDIQFVSGDTINGPLHSNDAILVNGNPSFQGTVTTSWPNCRAVNGVAPAATSCYRRTYTSDKPTFARGIAYRSEIELPTSIGDFNQYVTAPVKAGQTALGCLYTGPTRIKFLPTTGNATPQMQVWSRYSTSALNPGCGNYNTLKSGSSVTVNVPQNNVIVVRDVPSSQSSPASGPCAAGAIGDGLPQANDYLQNLGEADCRYGTLYVEGTLKGRVTISADNNIVITGDLTYAGGATGTDALGLIAENSVLIYHPVLQTATTTCTQRDKNNNCTKTTTTYSYSNMNRPPPSGQSTGTVFQDPTVNAAILTLQHSFGVDGYQYGDPLGKLNLFGSFAQRFRGLVGTSNSSGIQSGYLKNYNYDTRLRYAPPPFFLDPVRAGWGQKTFGEVTPRYGS